MNHYPQDISAHACCFRNIAIADGDDAAAFIYHCLVPVSLSAAASVPPAKSVNNGLDKILELSPDIICTVNNEAVFVSVNRAAEKIWGFTPAELMGKSLFEMVHPLDYTKTLQYGIDIISGNGSAIFENRYICKNGKTINMLWTVHWDAEDQLAFCIAKDTTEKSLQQEALASSEKKYRYLFQNNPTPMYIWDVETMQMTDCNDEALLLYGYTKEEFQQLSILDIRRKQDAGVITNRIKNVETLGKSYKTTTTHIKKNGDLIYVSISDHTLEYNCRKAILVHVTDITEQQKTEQLLHNKDTLYRSLVENSGDGVIILNPVGGPVYVTKSVNRILGYSEVETLQLNINDIVHPEDRHIVTDKMMESLQNEGLLIKGPPLRMMHRNGNYRWLDATLINMINEPAIQGIICNFRDVTDRINAVEALKISEEKYRQMFQFSPLPKWIYDIDTFEILQVNETAVRHFGYSREEFLNMTIKDLRRKEDVPALLSTVTANRAKSGTMNSGIFTHKKKNCDLIQMEISGYRLRYLERECIMVVSNDVTERENALQQLKDKETKLLTAQQIARLGYWQFDPVKNTMYWSDEVYHIWGIAKEAPEVTYDFFMHTVFKDDKIVFENAYRTAVEQHIQLDVQYRIVLPDGSIKWIHEIGKRLTESAENGHIFEGTIQDITDSRLAREQLLRSEARNRGIFESQTNYVIRTDVQGNYSFCNNKFIDDFGWRYPQGNLLGSSAMLSIMDYHHQRVMDTVEKCFANLNSVFQVEIDKPGKHGDVMTTLWDFSCITDEFGVPAEIQCVGIDISARKKSGRRFTAKQHSL